MDVIFGAQGGTGFSSNSPLYSDGIGLPGGRALADGNVAALITAVTAGVSGRGAARSIQIAVGSSYTGAFGVGAGGSAPGLVGWVDSSDWFCNGGTARFQVFTNGALNFSRGGGGSTEPGGFAGTLYGGYQYFLPPVAPNTPTMTSSATGQAEVAFSFTGDPGGISVNGYLVQVADNPDFISPIERLVSGAVQPYVFTGLTPGQTYYARATARNYVTDVGAQKGGAFSAPASVQVLAGVRAGVSGAWKDCTAHAGINGVWVPCQVMAGRSGAWVGLTS